MFVCRFAWRIALFGMATRLEADLRMRMFKKIETLGQDYFGENKILISQYVYMQRYYPELDLIIDIGNISGEYSYEFLFRNAEIWRISEDGNFKCRNSLAVSKIFN